MPNEPGAGDPAPAWRIEPMRARDVPEVAVIEKESFSTPWPRRAFLEELRHPEVSRCLVVREVGKGPVIGYACCWLVADELMINNIAVASGGRRRGAGRALMRHVMDAGLREGCQTAWLEVRPSNDAAIHLYASLGFEVVGRRRHYYTDTQEDALVMRTFLKALETG